MKNYFQGLINTAMLLIMATALAIIGHSIGIGKECLSMFFLLSVLFTTVITGGYTLGFINAVCSFFIINYLFTEPFYANRIYDRNDLILLISFLVTALVSGVVVGKLREQRDRAEENEKAAQELIRVRGEQEEIRFAMESEKLRSTLLRSVAHDLRTPLTALAGSSRLLDEDYDKFTDEERRAFISDISEETIWLTNQVENILNMTRISEGRLVINKEEEVVDDVINEAVKRTERLMSSHSLTVNLPEEVIILPMDGHLVVQVLVNLLSNAVAHTPEGTCIVLSANKKGDFVEFSVTDNGPGIDKKIESTLFDRYVTLKTAAADSKRGAGLGLAICKTIVEAHKGSISAHNVEPNGACFVFTLPMEG